MIILDTNVISEAAKLDMDASVRRWLGLQSMSNLYATAVSVAEVSFGVERMPEGRRKEIVRDDMRMIFAKARAKGFAIAMPDGQIAAIAKVHGFTVATRDTSPFRAAGIPVINPWEN